jgi:hypothetical protein
MDREIIIGRSSDLDMVLVEDMVSRKHAKIETFGGHITIADMGSTNGTFVNGEKVKKVPLKEGDRILVGTSIIKLVAVDPAAAVEVSEKEARARLESTGQKRSASASGQGRPMSGSIEEIPLPDLLQLLSTSRKSGVLAVRSNEGFGKIYLRKGQIYFSSIDDAFDVNPRKAVYRLLTWSSGTFELEPPDEKQVLEEMQESTEALLMEGVRQLDELRRIEADVPPRAARLAVPTPLAARLRDLTPEELDTFQLVLDWGAVAAVVDKYPGTDLEANTALVSLLKRMYVVAR